MAKPSRREWLLLALLAGQIAINVWQHATLRRAVRLLVTCYDELQAPALLAANPQDP